MALAAILLAVGCRGADQPPSPTWTPTDTPTIATTVAPTPTPTPSLEEEVLSAYARYWDVYADALLRLDGSRLSEVMTGPRLQRAIDEIEDLRSQGRAVRVLVQNAPLVAATGADEAAIVDEYVNSSYLIDASTQEPIGDRGEPNTLRDTFTLVLEEDGWKVRDSLRQVEP